MNTGAYRKHGAKMNRWMNTGAYRKRVEPAIRSAVRKALAARNKETHEHSN